MQKTNAEKKQTVWNKTMWKKTLWQSGLSVFIVSATIITIAKAGPILLPHPPTSVPSATGYTLEDIYQKLTNNTSATEGDHDLTSATSPATMMHTLTDIYNAIGAPSAPLKTGQTTCWDASGNSISCTGSNQDGESQRGSAHSYTDNNDGTITANATGLMWKKCSEGQSGSDCSGGSASYLDWATAITTCEADTTAGHTDWHLPNQNELFSLVDFSVVSPSINSTYFPNTQSGRYWSATTYQFPGYEYYAWYVYFYNGSTIAFIKGYTFYVRCLR